MKLTLISALLLASCSVNSTSVLYNPSKKTHLGEGSMEEYSPKIVRVELEHGEKSNLNKFTSFFYGRDGNEFEIGTDFGVKLREQKSNTYLDYYVKASFGLIRYSKRFKEHDFQNNFHINLGAGIEIKKEGCDLIFGIDYNHGSTGKKVNPFAGKGRNPGVNTLGPTIGFSCKR